MGTVDPGRRRKGAGGDISGKHPSAYYDEVDKFERDEEESET
jgi:hypothetical protein